MITVGIRDLKQRLSELIRRAREEGQQIQVTHHGKVVALLVPVDSPYPLQDENAWVKLDMLAAEIGSHWPEGVTSVHAVAEGRE
jgi:prevent-host-death family protein